MEISNFLAEFKALGSVHGIFVENRTKNINGLATLGITKAQRRDEIMTLSVSHYCTGPDADRDRPGDVWIFGKMINGIEVYIKLKIFGDSNGKYAKCISFHPAEFPLCFPYGT